MTTMNSEEIISLYEAVSVITDQMVAAARSGDWEQLTLLESRCASHVNTLKQGEPPVALSGPSREKKVQIIHKILADDREIRNITEPWMAQLSALMNNAGAERKLAIAYGGNQVG
ncbi:MAG: flagellar protein FliT [Pseudomonadota bacterium]